MGIFKTDEEKKKEYIDNAMELANRSDHDKAVKELEKALKLFPKDEETLYNLGFVHSEMDDYQNAYEYFKKLININPKHIDAFNSLGMLFARQGKISDSIFVYQKGIENNPSSAVLHNNLGNVYYDTGNFEKAVGFFKKSGELDPAFNERLYHLGISSMLKEDDVSGAMAKLEEAAKKNINKAKDAHDLGIAYMDRKMFDKAIESFNKALTIDPNYLSAYTSLGACYQNKERYDLAIKAYEKALTLNPKSAKIYNTIGLIYDKLDKPETAVTAYRKAVALDPTYANSHYMLGQVYQNRGSTDKAVAEFTKHIRIHEHGAMVDDAMQRIAEIKSMPFEEVKALFDQYIDKKPEQQKQQFTPPPQTAERDQQAYLKSLKDKMSGRTSHPPAQPQTAAVQPPVQPAGTVSFSAPQPAVLSPKPEPVRTPSAPIDPNEYLKRMKDKLKNKPSTDLPAQTDRLIQPAEAAKPPADFPPIQPVSLEAEPLKNEIELPPADGWDKPADSSIFSMPNEIIPVVSLETEAQQSYTAMQPEQNKPHKNDDDDGPPKLKITRNTY